MSREKKKKKTAAILKILKINLYWNKKLQLIHTFY